MPKRFKWLRMGMSRKISISIFSIITILIVSALISIAEFRVMSTYVSDSISGNIKDINLSTEVSVVMDQYNSMILTLVGNADSLTRVDVDLKPYEETVMNSLDLFVQRGMPYADSLKASCERYLRTSYQLDSVIASDFSDTRDWYFTELQPTYNQMRRFQDSFNTSIYDNLHDNSIDFDESFYRGVTPGIVSVGAAVLLLLLLLFYILVFYIRPFNKMLKSLNEYKHYGMPYNNVFEGDDQLQELNSGIGDVLDENITLKKRIRSRES